MYEALIFLIPVFLITLVALKLHHASQTFSANQKHQIADLQLRKAILQKKVMSMLEIEKKHLESLQILNKKVYELKREVIFQKQVNDQ